MKPRRRRWRALGRLQARLLLTVAGGAVAFALLAAAAAYALGAQRSQADARRTLDDLATAVEKTVQIGTFSSDTVLLGEVAGGLVGHPLLLRAVIRDAAGRVLVDTGTAARPPADWSLLRPVLSPFDARERIGTLELLPDADEQRRSARAEARTLALPLVAQTLLVALLVYAVAARLVSAPIVHTAGALRRMQPGTAERLPTPPLHQHDEIGELIAGANALLQANQLTLQRERALRAEIEAMEAQYREIFDSTSAGIFVLTPSGRLLNSNPTALRVVGMPLREMRDLRETDFLREVFAWPERVEAMIREALRSGHTVSGDLELRRRDQGLQWVHCLISVQGHDAAEGGRPGAQRLIEAVMYDVTERIRTEHHVRYQAEHDMLTGLRNRVGFEARVERMLAAPQHPALCLLYIDLDGFKRVNDELGHAAGDGVLRACALRMKHAVRRGTDSVARLGGDEFAVVLQHAGGHEEVVARMAAHLLAALCEPIKLVDGRTAQVGASIGIATAPRHGATLQALAEAADAAMYEVKRTGKNSFATAWRAPPA
ncbi:diguanylate cyclase domain-containing protein [Aquincola sp. J276]|uniref:diguanylate cyclase domain-containing protein n=1 Tax=Aquincola sp. J276 TaxID=2898432 RepID=UPI0021511B3E|nr:diguanylate cyclase [Aquincola sp. J276]MCR5866542.1 diguanylate cyclase [Aquincola sp. J276]